MEPDPAEAEDGPEAPIVAGEQALAIIAASEHRLGRYRIGEDELEGHFLRSSR